jgi:hypothetical protein
MAGRELVSDVMFACSDSYVRSMIEFCRPTRVCEGGGFDCEGGPLAGF